MPDVLEADHRQEEDDSSSDSGPPPVPSTVVGLYHVKDLLGSGSYSVVHRGVNKETNQEVAVKFEWVKAEKGRRLLAEAHGLGEIGRRFDLSGGTVLHLSLHSP